MSFIIKYNPLFSITIRQSKKLPAAPPLLVTPPQVFELLPSFESTKLFETYELAVRKRSYGVEVFYKSYPQQAVSNQLLNPINDKIRFSFGIYATLASVKRHFSESVSASTKHLYFNNLDSDGSTILGHNAELGSLEVDHSNNSTSYEADRVAFINIRPPVFQFTTLKLGDNTYPYDKIVVKSVEDAGMSPKTFDLDLKENPQIVTTFIDLSNCSNGRYTMQEPDDTLIQEIYLQDELSSNDPFGIMDIFWDTQQASQNNDFRKYFVNYDEIF